MTLGIKIDQDKKIIDLKNDVPVGANKLFDAPALAQLEKPEENRFEIHDSTAADFNAFFLEKLDFFPNSGAFRLALESTHPTGCGHHPVSRHLGRIGIVLHGLADSAIGLGAERMRNLLVGRYSPAGHLP